MEKRDPKAISVRSREGTQEIYVHDSSESTGEQLCSISVYGNHKLLNTRFAYTGFKTMLASPRFMLVSPHANQHKVLHGSKLCDHM